MISYEQALQFLLSAFNKDLFKYRFIDVRCIEEFGKFAVFSYPVSYLDADKAKATAD